MNDPIKYWHVEHRGFLRLLDLFERQLGGFHSGARPDYDLMLDIVTYLRFFPDRHHHPREDVAFERLLRHDADLQPAVNRLLQEHRVIALAGAELHALLSDANAGALVARERIEAAAATYLVYYRHHIQKEEREIMPRAAALLTEADWAAVAHAVPGGADPLFGAEADARYRELRRQIELEFP